MSRIKIRVSAGVFEVSLLRVIDETKSVEVLWDRGVKREFKWGRRGFRNYRRTDGLDKNLPTWCQMRPVRTSLLSRMLLILYQALAPQSVMSFRHLHRRILTKQHCALQYSTTKTPAPPYAPPTMTGGYSAGAYSYQYQSQLSPVPGPVRKPLPIRQAILCKDSINIALLNIRQDITLINIVHTCSGNNHTGVQQPRSLPTIALGQ